MYLTKEKLDRYNAITANYRKLWLEYGDRVFKEIGYTRNAFYFRSPIPMNIAYYPAKWPEYFNLSAQAIRYLKLVKWYERRYELRDLMIRKDLEWRGLKPKTLEEKFNDLLELCAKRGTKVFNIQTMTEIKSK